MVVLEISFSYAFWVAESAFFVEYKKIRNKNVVLLTWSY